MKRFLYGFIAIFLLSCSKNDKKEKEIAAIDVNVELKRFDEAWAGATPDKLDELKANYPYLFPEQFPDSVWVSKMQDTLQQELSSEVLKEFPDLTIIKEELADLFRHTKYYFPDFSEPKVITLTSEVDYRNKVVYADSLMFIALDNYLGSEHRFYQGIQKYIRKNFTKAQIISDAASQIARRRISKTDDRTFLAQMVLYGKELYMKDLLIPSVTDARKLGYTLAEMEWAIANEDEVWRYFVEKDLLFSTDARLAERFLQPAPFSKFQLELDQESPGELGRFTGWQIVRAYMKNNDVSLQQMLRMPAQELFERSGYKPRK